MIRAIALVAALLAAPVPGRASERRRRLAPEVCPSQERPAVTSFAVPEPIRERARRVELVEKSRRPERSRRDRAGRWFAVVVAAAAGATLVMSWR